MCSPWEIILLNGTAQWRIQDFPLGGADPLGGANLQCVHFLAKMYVKMKEIDPVGGAPAAPPWIRQCSEQQIES